MGLTTLHIRWHVFVMAFVVMLLPASGLVSATPRGLPKITITYFYNNPCASCNEEGKFYDTFNALVGDNKEGVALEFLNCNTFLDSGQAKYLEVCKKYKIPKDKQIVPMVIINGVALIGATEIDGKLAAVFEAEKQKALRQAAENNENASAPVYFYISPFEECALFEQYLNGLPAVFPVSHKGRQFVSPFFARSYNGFID